MCEEYYSTFVPFFVITEIPQVFFKIQNWAGSKNSLVHPELWVCHFGRFPDFAIFPSLKSHLLTPATSPRRTTWCMICKQGALESWWSKSGNKPKWDPLLAFGWPGTLTLDVTGLQKF